MKSSSQHTRKTQTSPARIRLILNGPSILWGDGVLQGDSIVSGCSQLWDCNVGSKVHLEAFSDTWTASFIDPSSIMVSDESILVYGETGAPTGMKLASADSIYFPAIR